MRNLLLKHLKTVSRTLDTQLNKAKIGRVYVNFISENDLNLRGSMNIEHFYKFEEYLDKGLKKEATESIKKFIASLKNSKETADWVWKYLPKLNQNCHARVRHELFHEVIFPVLHLGYQRKQFKSTLWLGKLSQNLYQNKTLHACVDWMTELDFYREAYELAPNDNEARLLLLNAIVSRLRHSEHEWPSGILYGNHGATLEQCHGIAEDVKNVLAMDKKHQYDDFISQYNQKLRQYQEGLSQ